MAIEKFHMRCDICKKAGPEYDRGFTVECIDCGLDFCQVCDLAMYEDAFDDQSNTSICFNCDDKK